MYLPERDTADLGRVTTISQIAEGQFSNVVQVIELNPVEHTSRDVSKDIAREVMTIWAHRGEPLADQQVDFIVPLEISEMQTKAVSSRASVVNFAAQAPARRKAATGKRPLPDHPDAELITACLEYAHHEGFAHIYHIDPTDSEFASVLHDRASASARRALSRLYELEADTMDGLYTKTQLIPLLLADGPYTTLNEQELQLLRSIADDAKRLHSRMRLQRVSDVSLTKSKLTEAGEAK